MSHYDRAARLCQALSTLEEIKRRASRVVAQVHATLAVADSLGRLAAPGTDVASRLEAAVTGHSDAMAMVDQEIDQMLAETDDELAASSADTAAVRRFWGRREALTELRRRLHEVGEPARCSADCPSCEWLRAEHASPGDPQPDPLAHVQVGDPDPNCGECGSVSDDWHCTREPGHPGQHIASDSVRVCAVWGAS